MIEKVAEPIDTGTSGRRKKIETLLTVVYVVPPLIISLLIIIACIVWKLARNRARAWEQGARARAWERRAGEQGSGGTLIVGGQT